MRRRERVPADMDCGEYGSSRRDEDVLRGFWILGHEIGGRDSAGDCCGRRLRCAWRGIARTGEAGV
jgi:hypothetical protein